MLTSRTLYQCAVWFIPAEYFICLRMLTSFPLFQTPLDEGEEENVRLFASIMQPDVPHTIYSVESKVEEEEEAEREDTVLLSWRQILWLLTIWDPLIQYSTWLRHLHLAMDHPPKAHKMLAMDQRERHILTALRQILLAADTTILNTRVESTKQRFFTL